MERVREGGGEAVAGLLGDVVQGEVGVEVLQFDEEQLAAGGAAGVDALDAVVEGVPVDEAAGEGEVVVGGLVRFEEPAALGVGGVQGVLEGVVDEVEGHLVAEVDPGLDEDVAVAEAGELPVRQERQTDGVGARLGLDRVRGGLGQPVEVLGPVDGGDDGESGGGQVEQVLLARHVAAAVQRVVDPDAAGQGALAEGVVLLLVAEDGAAVADDDGVEAVHQGGGVERVTERQVEVLAQPGGEADVLVAVAPSAGRVGEVGDVQEAGAGGHGAAPRSVTANVSAGWAGLVRRSDGPLPN